MRKKGLLEYAVIGLFIMCLGLALSASLEYVTRATEREYLLQGKWLLLIFAVTLILFVIIRIGCKLSKHMGKGLKTATALLLMAVFMAVGFAARLWVINNIDIQPSSDFETYWRIANHLLNGTMLSPEADLYRGYVARYPHTIGFPMMVLWPVFTLFGATVKNALYANLALNMLSIVVAGRIGKRIGGWTGALVAVAAMSLWPSHIMFSSMIATEPAFTLLILIAADMLSAALDRREGSLYFAAPERGILLLPLGGIALAVAGAIRPMAVVLLAAYAVIQLFGFDVSRADIPKDGAQHALSKGWLCLILVLVPYFLTGSIISRAIEETIMEKPAGGLFASGYNLMVGVNTQSGGLWNQEDADFFAEAFDETGSATRAHQACLQKALERVRNSPEDVLNLLVYKFRDLWQTDDFGVDWNLLWTGQQDTLTPELTDMLERVRPIGRVAYMCLLLYALAQALNMWRRKSPPEACQMVFMLFYLGTALAHMLLETQVRYHYNMIPFLIFLASAAISDWRLRESEEPAPIVIIREDSAAEKEEAKEHERFDLVRAINEGHIKVTVSEGYVASGKPKKTDIAAFNKPR